MFLNSCILYGLAVGVWGDLRGRYRGCFPILLFPGLICFLFYAHTRESRFSGFLRFAFAGQVPSGACPSKPEASLLW